MSDDLPGISRAPWTADQACSLDAYQGGGFHPFTCGNDACRATTGGEPLTATVGGWECRHCDYRQDWAHAWMTDWSWRRGPTVSTAHDFMSYTHAPALRAGEFLTASREVFRLEPDTEGEPGP